MGAGVDSMRCATAPRPAVPPTLAAVFGRSDPRALAARIEQAKLAARSGRKDDARDLLATAKADLDPRHPAYRTAMAAEADLDDTT